MMSSYFLSQGYPLVLHLVLPKFFKGLLVIDLSFLEHELEFTQHRVVFPHGPDILVVLMEQVMTASSHFLQLAHNSSEVLLIFLLLTLHLGKDCLIPQILIRTIFQFILF